MSESFTLFRPTFTDPKTGKRRACRNYYVRFRCHLGKRHRWPAYASEKQSLRLALHIERLVNCRRECRPPDAELQKFLDVAPPDLLRRLEAEGLLDARPAALPLKAHLEGVKDADGKLIEPGFRQVIESRGSTAQHAATTVRRAAVILDGVGLAHWADLLAPGAADRVAVFLAGLRADGKIVGQTVNYYARDFRSFCRWLAGKLKSPVVPMAELAGVSNAAVDSGRRRALGADEVQLLIEAAVAAGDRFGASGDDRGLLYLFAFLTGIRPGQMRSLVVGDFKLAADPATVHTHAQYVKRRRDHVQIIRADLAAELRERFRGKLPAVPAFTMPSKHVLARMIRADLATARERWIAAASSDRERAERMASDFLAAVNQDGEAAVFYSTRHGHGSALADAGVPEKDIAASMHHASRATTARYLHASARDRRSAVDALPAVGLPRPGGGPAAKSAPA